jgi:hypothetical protein
LAVCVTSRVELPFEAAMPSGAIVVVRRATSADGDAVAALNERLDTDDRYARFFTGAGASRAFVDRWLGAPDGDVLVAMVGAKAVGEAGCVPGARGWCELGITVDRAFRGWLGPYLLDVVLALAGERGHGAVVADVLATNRQMLGLVASRGHAVMPSGDLSVVRVLLGTREPVPGWGERTERPRALVEFGRAGSTATLALAHAGYDVVACPGPRAAHARRWSCPALAGATCPLVAGADVVLAAGGGDERGASLLGAIRRTHPDTPVCDVAGEPSAAAIVAVADEARGADRDEERPSAAAAGAGASRGDD